MSDVVTAPRADLDELGRLLAEATPGPWDVECSHADPSIEVHLVMGVLRDRYGDNSISTDDHATAALIAALVNAAPALLAEVADLRETVARVKALRDEWRADDEDSLNRVGQHLMGGAVLSCAEHLDAALDGAR